MEKLYLAWRNPDTTSWHPIGLLTKQERLFRFRYLRGAQSAAEFTPLASFPKLDVVYESEELFPLFGNRLMVPGRKDHTDYLKWLDLKAPTPMQELAASGGVKIGDSLEVFACPDRAVEGKYRVKFFLHGLRYQTQKALVALQTATVGQALSLEAEPGNKHDLCAHRIEFNGLQIGYVPRYLSCDIAQLKRGQHSLNLSAINVDAPLSHRYRCEFSAVWPEGFSPLRDEAFAILTESIEV
jgi:hypothetical protein